jgi:hypothetical protein
LTRKLRYRQISRVKAFVFLGGGIGQQLERLWPTKRPSLSDLSLKSPLGWDTMEVISRRAWPVIYYREQGSQMDKRQVYTFFQTFLPVALCLMA